jgi:acetolactate synthase-like protein
MTQANGGAIIADVLRARGVPFIFTLCGGHISPILVESKARDIRVIDVRDEKNAVFAADAVARMTGIPGVAAVTAGPGVTNTLTAVKNAQMAQSPIIVFGGAAATVLKGRGSLQDIDQLSVMRPVTKWAASLKTVADLGPAVERAFDVAMAGVPGPVFLEVPIDLLYPEALVRDWYIKEAGVSDPKDLGAKALRLYLEGHLYRQFKAPHVPVNLPRMKLPSLGEVAANLPPPERDVADAVEAVAGHIARAKRPVLVLGSQTLVNVRDAEPIADAVRRIGLPTWLGGTARGLLGRQDPLQLRHKRGNALKEADLVIICGFPFDFRLGYGVGINKRATLVSVNLSAVDLRKNRRPEVPLQMHPGEFLKALAGRVTPPEVDDWFETLREREAARDADIAAQADTPAAELVNPLKFCMRLEEKMADDAVLVVDGGDFVATASYIVRPRAPLSWLDPGVFGTLGVGGGFAAGAALCRPGKEIWLIYGDGSSAYSLAEFDTFARHGLAPIAVIGNDGAWAQIAREQTEIFGDDVACVLPRADYHTVAEGYGGKGILLTDPSRIDEALDEAKAIAASGKPVCLNVHIAKTDFRKGSISV